MSHNSLPLLFYSIFNAANEKVLSGRCGYLALNHQSREGGGALRSLGLWGRGAGGGLAAVVLLVRAEAPLALLRGLPLLRGVVRRALASLLAVGLAVLGVGQGRADPGAGVAGLPSQPGDVPLQQAALDDAVRLLERRKRIKTFRYER